ncbi:hybrid sensor histidine kinase/response regulator [Paramagnetospirillum marisnigri]|uniref:Chemotaxis protein CheA n=1 Tax=Paramagnetospirillum marisnigri TaxID=1285242 RepID=A0A178MWV9_9PROT|nr:hybrid sensor histidine kinase/response regulator [Paramagnetospirillum marisnigri]OAN53953.1 hybrid sensor histidine kinase/response regulator [Paramagnetospirillum marisnigri]
MALDIKRFTARFVDEARDHLRKVEDGLAILDADPTDSETVNAIFRSAHTVKGSSRMLKLVQITETAHKVEDVLGALREGSLAWTPDLRRLLQRGIDALGAQVDMVAEGGQPSEPDPALCAALAAVLGNAPTEPASAPQQPAAPSAAPITEATTPAAAPPPEVRLKSADTVRVQLTKLDELIRLMGEVVSSHARLRQRLVDIRQIERDTQDLGEQAQITGFARDLREDVFSQELLMDELHAKALVMRMLPLAIVLEPAARLIRDLGRSLGKDVECAVVGTEIELDRQLIDRLNDPIVHLLRNSVDHGIEDAATRKAAGKPAFGTIRLGARQDGGWVVVEVADDGGGLPLPAIRDKAVRKGLVTAEQAAAMPDSEAIDLIFSPGFSTSSIITEVSGRGVGMDVVKRTIVDDLQGVIGVETVPGKGTTFFLRLPLSLAVMRVLVVSAGGQSFGFTAQYVAQLLELPPTRLLSVAERDAVVIDNEFIPVVSLAGVLGLPEGRPLRNTLLLVVVRVRNEKLALRVDELLDERDMVIKPLPEHLRHLPLVAGMVMTGRNTLVSVLHAPVLLDMARRARTPAVQAGTGNQPAAVRVLVVDDSLNTREIEKDVLEAHGYVVTLAEDGLDGLQKARAGDFDAVLTDVEMPNMDGFSLTAALRQEERYRERPIIIVTSREKEEDKRRGIQVGADAYIVKGDFDQSSLVDTLRSLLG